MDSRIASVEPAADRVLIVRNPHAGPGPGDDSTRELADCIRGHGMLADVVSDLDSIGWLAGQYQEKGQLRAVVAAGGDGTVAEVVNRTAPDVPVTVFPLGTANLLARYLGIKRDPAAMAHMLREGAIVRLDAGRANGRIFLAMVGCGFDADVVHRLHRKRSGRHISYWTWTWPILESIRSYGFPRLRVYCDSPPQAPDEAAHVARWVFVVNLPVYAGGLNVAPQAVGTDGKLNVGTFAGGSFWHGLRYVGNVALGRHHKLRDFQSNTATRVRIESDEPVSYQLDGDPGGLLPLEIEVMPARLTLLAPQAQARELAFQGETANPAGA